jgi:hypothetical protein
MHASLSDIERMMEAEGREMLRAMMQAHFDLRSAQEREVPVTDADGIEHAKIRRGTRQVETKFGEVTLDRRLYQAPATEALAPLDAAMGLADEKYSLEVRRIVAEEAARASFDEVVELVRKQSGAEVPKRQAEELAVRAARDFDDFYRSRLREPEASEQLLVLSFDAKGIAMLHRDLREATRKKAESTPRRLETRLTKGEKPNRKRMAEVATVYSIDAWPRTLALHGAHDAQAKAQRRPRPINKRVWASIAETFSMSILSSAIRFTELSPERCAAVFSSRREVAWCVPSKTCTRDVPRGRRLDPGSIASDFYSKGAIDLEPVRVPADAWFETSADVEIVEHATASSEFGTVLSMLWIPDRVAAPLGMAD